MSAAFLGLVPCGEPSHFQKAPPASVSRKVPPPPRVTSLDVTVHDPKGQPLEGAFVLAAPVTGAYVPFGGLAADRIRSTLTGREGKARLESLPPGPWNVTVRARGFVPQPLRRIASGPLLVRLEKGGVITGVVLDAERRRPVARARVAIDGGLSLPDAWQEEASRVEATTDAQGRFTLEGIGRLPVRINARAPGFGRAERDDVRAGARIELFLFRGATLAGAVRDDAGRPVKGALVRAESDGFWVPAPLSERSDARGGFVLAGVRPGEYVVVAREGSRAPGIASVVVEPEAEAEAEIVLSDGGFVTGRVVDGEGRPLGGRARVEVFGDHGLPSFASDLMTAEVKADGTFALGPLPLGTLGIDISAPRHASKRVEATIPARGRAADLGDVVLETGLAIRGRVRDKEGNGVGEALVRAFGPQGSQSRGEATSEDDGALLIAGLGAGVHELTASKEGLAAGRGKAQAGGDPVELIMEAGGEIAGRVVDGQGQPAEDATIRADMADDREPGGMRNSSGNADEGEGRFVLHDVLAGTYVVQARATGRGEASVTGVRVVAGRTTNLGTITLQRGGVIQGFVVDTDGQGIPGASVGAERDVNRRTGQLQTQTDSVGAFEIRGAPAGKLNVAAYHPAYAPARRVIAEVDPEKEPVPVRIVLVRGARVEGRALHRDGSPFASGRVSVYSMEPGAVMGVEPVAVAANGSFVIDHLAPGRAMVNLMAYTPSSPMVSGGPGLNILTGVASREADLRENETASVDLTLRDVVVAGRVTRGGEPAPGIRVFLRSASGGSVFAFAGPTAPGAVLAAGGPTPLTAVTRDDGGYELLAFTPGPAFVDLSSAAGSQRYPGREVTVPDSERFELDMEVGDTTVSGIVVDGENGQPVADANVGLNAAEPDGKWKGGAAVGPDGRFSIGVEPGEYRLGAQAPGRKRASMPVTVGAGGVSGLRVELEPGLEITGRVVDVSGRAVSGVLILASDAEGRSGGYANSLADGAFRIRGLEAQPYTLAAGSDLAGWAIRSGLSPRDEPVTLTLQPGGHIAVRVLGDDERPVKDAYPRVRTVGGQRVSMPGRVSGPTDPNGLYELDAPAGPVEVEVHKDAQTARGTVTVRAGETVPLVLHLP